MTEKKAARSCDGSSRAKVSNRDADIVSDKWTAAQCRAIEWSLGGGFAALAALEVMFGW